MHIILPIMGWFSGIVPHAKSMRAYSPNAVLHLLHDGPAFAMFNTAGFKFDHVDDIGRHSASYARFLKTAKCKTYSGLHTHSYHRNFAALDYAKATGLKSFWYFDWDVLVFFDVDNESDRLGAYKGMRHNGHFFVNDVPFFEHYLESWLAHPATCESEAETSEQTLERRIWAETDIGKHYADASRQQDDGSFFDDNLAISGGGFEITEGKTQAEGMKCLMWKRVGTLSYPHAWHKPSSRWARLKTLHCWGVHKTRMDRYLQFATTQ